MEHASVTSASHEPYQVGVQSAPICVERPSIGHRRLVSVDVLRGATIVGMVLINDPAVGPPFLYHQLTHAAWDGWTVADIIFPFFLFVVGLSLALSFRARRPARLLRRAALLLGVGLVLNAAPLILAGNGAAAVVAHLRVMGVLQRIAVADLIASLVVLWLPPAGEVVVTGVLLVGYWAVLAWVPVPGHHAGLLTPSVNVSGWVDRMVLGSAHMYPAGVITRSCGSAT